MLFSSFAFAVFFPAVFVFYWFAANKNLKIQNLLLLAASYVFYGWWDWRFLLLLASLSIGNFLVGISIERHQERRMRKFWLLTGLAANIGSLVVFKYAGFFIDSFLDLISLVGYDLPRHTTRIIIPLGISFYVFLSISYILDVYHQRLIARKNIIEVLLTLSFFPIILAGPIQRPASRVPLPVTLSEVSRSPGRDRSSATGALHLRQVSVFRSAQHDRSSLIHSDRAAAS